MTYQKDLRARTVNLLTELGLPPKIVMSEGWKIEPDEWGGAVLSFNLRVGLTDVEFRELMGA